MEAAIQLDTSNEIEVPNNIDVPNDIEVPNNIIMPTEITQYCELSREELEARIAGVKAKIALLEDEAAEKTEIRRQKEVAKLTSGIERVKADLWDLGVEVVDVEQEKKKLQKSGQRGIGKVRGRKKRRKNKRGKKEVERWT